METTIHGVAHGEQRKFLEAAKSLNPTWLQGFENQKVTVQFRPSKEIPEGDLMFLANTFDFELVEKRITGTPWIEYFFR